ncbi:hypothetical protein [Streptomyces sp. PSKA30]|uniref:hypothetical protein n=1 Tax=Streptomyces sp. PSKA30 TaxID=2874597 RepID=UPI001CD1361D|nr:hypothetical protein [Streptomyces sp. PSKA30]MBZ9641551.1 hypothetical protein [Streptomyces sp. PSKA30]
MTYTDAGTRLAGCAVAASAVLLTWCTTSGNDEDRAAVSSPPGPTAMRTASSPSEKKLTEQAQAALAAVHSGTLVEAGVERVTDGIHTEPGLRGRQVRFW